MMWAIYLSVDRYCKQERIRLNKQQLQYMNHDSSIYIDLCVTD